MKTVEPTIIKESTCKSSSGQSTLTYHIGKDQSGIYFRIYGNTGTGFFSKEWISLADIQEAISKSDKPFTSTVLLYPLFQRKSINTAAFLMAVLLDLGLVKRSKRCYESVDPSAFMESIKPAKPATKHKAATKTTAKAKTQPKPAPKIAPKTAQKQPTR